MYTAVKNELKREVARHNGRFYDMQFGVYFMAAGWAVYIPNGDDANEQAWAAIDVLRATLKNASSANG